MKEPDLSDTTLRELTVRHVKAGYSSVYKYALVLEAERDALLVAIPEPSPQHEPDFRGVPCPYGLRGPWDITECGCGYWGRLEDWALSINTALAALPEYLRGDDDEQN